MIKAGIVGFRGYSGAELIQILQRHAGATVFLMEHRLDAGDRPLPRGAGGPARIPATADAARDAGLDVVFLATPPEVSMELASGFMDAGAKVIDLSGAFRLRTADNYTRWYKEPHTQPDLLASAVYGLPELNRTLIAAAKLISNPGCYPTAATLAIAPLIDAGVVDRNAGIVCDAKSGVSGAGRKPSLKTSFCEVTENFSAYSILEHRHVAEVLLNTGIGEHEFSFTAQLIPVHRGILETIYFRAVGLSSAADLVALYETRYAGEPFVRIYDAGKTPDLLSVARTNFCDIGVALHAASGRAVVVAAIDNLGKGAAGQAVQNMNLAFALPETQGLL
jgi:N-acetyl-gamma-glutamyl-phosphate reductase